MVTKSTLSPRALRQKRRMEAGKINNRRRKGSYSNSPLPGEKSRPTKPRGTNEMEVVKCPKAACPAFSGEPERTMLYQPTVSRNGIAPTIQTPTEAPARFKKAPSLSAGIVPPSITSRPALTTT